MNTSPWRKIKDRVRDRELKREAVLRAAARAFNEKGFHNTSLDDVAARLNVTKPTLYYYVKSKDEILAECIRLGIALVEDAAFDPVDGTHDTGHQKLISVMRKYAEIVTMDFGRCVILVGEDDLTPEGRKNLRALKKRIDRTFRRCVEEGVRDGSIAPCNPKFATFTLAGALSWIARWYDESGPLGPSEVGEECIKILLKGLEPRLAEDSKMLASAAVDKKKRTSKRASSMKIA
jgi:AcrR family transcriptional regulator